MQIKKSVAVTIIIRFVLFLIMISLKLKGQVTIDYFKIDSSGQLSYKTTYWANHCDTTCFCLERKINNKWVTEDNFGCRCLFSELPCIPKPPLTQRHDSSKVSIPIFKGKNQYRITISVSSKKTSKEITFNGRPPKYKLVDVDQIIKFEKYTSYTIYDSNYILISKDSGKVLNTKILKKGFYYIYLTTENKLCAFNKV